MRALVLTTSILIAALVACSAGDVAKSSSPPSADAGAVEQPPPKNAEDASVPDAPPPKSPCPAPGKIAPSDLPPGYLAPTKVKLRFPLDGDTAHFDFPDALNRSVRFLFVNAEETSGDFKTEFGVETSAIIKTSLQDASEIVIALEESAPGTGTPALDKFDRWLGLIFLDGDLLQTRMIREGLSPYFTSFGCAKSPLHPALLHAEAEANTAKRGLWKPGHPTDYEKYAGLWLGSSGCRPNPFKAPYCP